MHERYWINIDEMQHSSVEDYVDSACCERVCEMRRVPVAPKPSLVVWMRCEAGRETREAHLIVSSIILTLPAIPPLEPSRVCLQPSVCLPSLSINVAVTVRLRLRQCTRPATVMHPRKFVYCRFRELSTTEACSSTRR